MNFFAHSLRKAGLFVLSISLMLGELAMAQTSSNRLSAQSWRQMFLTDEPSHTGIESLLVDPKQFEPYEVETLKEFLIHPETQQALLKAEQNRAKYVTDIQKRAKQLAEQYGIQLEPYAGTMRSFQAFIDALTKQGLSPVSDQVAENRAVSIMRQRTERLDPNSIERSESDMNRNIQILKMRELLSSEELRKIQSKKVSRDVFEAWRAGELKRLEKERAENFKRMLQLLIELYPGEVVYAETEGPHHVINLDGRTLPLTAELIESATFRCTEIVGLGDRSSIRGGDYVNSPLVPTRWHIRLRDGKEYGVTTLSSRSTESYMKTDEIEGHSSYISQMMLPVFNDKKHLAMNLTSQERAAKLHLIKLTHFILEQSEMQVQKAVRGNGKEQWDTPLIYSSNLYEMIQNFSLILTKKVSNYPEVNTPFWRGSSYDPTEKSEIDEAKRLFWLNADLNRWTKREKLAAKANAPLFPAGKDVDRVAYYYHKSPAYYSDILRSLITGPFYANGGGQAPAQDPLRGLYSNNDAPKKPENAIVKDEHKIILFTIDKKINQEAIQEFVRTGREVPDLGPIFYGLANPYEEASVIDYTLPKHAGEVTVSTKAAYNSFDGMLNIPTPKNHILTGLHYLEYADYSIGKDLYAGKDYEVKFDKKNSAYFIQLKGENKKNQLYRFSAMFQKDPSAPPLNAPIPPQLLNLNGHMMDLSNQLQKANLKFLAMGVRELFLDYKMQGKSISVFDLERIFKQFSAAPSTTTVWGNPDNAEGVFAEYARFADRNGVLCAKCMPSNMLFKEVLKYILSQNVHVENVSGMATTGLTLAGQNRHMVTKVIVEGYAPVWLDVTPEGQDEMPGQLSQAQKLDVQVVKNQESPEEALKIYMAKMEAAVKKIGVIIAKAKVRTHQDDPWAKTGVLAEGLRSYFSGTKNLADLKSQDQLTYLKDLAAEAKKEKLRLQQIYKYAMAHPTMNGADKYLNFELKLAAEELMDLLASAEFTLERSKPINSCREVLTQAK